MPQNIKIAIPVSVFQEGDYYVAYSYALEVSSYGLTIDEATEGFDEAVEIFFEETRERGTLENELLRLGWLFHKKPHPGYEPPQKPEPKKTARKAVKTFDESFAIPL